MSASNGDRERMLEEKRRQQREQREHQRNQQREQSALQEAFQSAGTSGEDVIDQLLDDDYVTDDAANDAKLHTRTVGKIKNMMSRDWVLANLTDAQEHDIRYKLEVLKIKVKGAHPPADSAITGDARAYLLDDETQGLHPLSHQQRILIDELFESLKARMTRGRGGFEREQMNTSIARTETGNDEGSDSDDGGFSLFS